METGKLGTGWRGKDGERKLDSAILFKTSTGNRISASQERGPFKEQFKEDFYTRISGGEFHVSSTCELGR